MRFLLSALKAEQAESVLVPEMRPELWGAQVVARELLEHERADDFDLGQHDGDALRSTARFASCVFFTTV